MSRYPFSPYPTGWYFLLGSSELAPGSMQTGRWFGQELVAFRTRAGRVAVADAFCPHMGAHFGHGGEVRGDLLRCPFHGFCFDAEGECVSTPYEGKVPPKARLQIWPVAEQNGLILVWFDEAGRAPLWQVPSFDESGWLPFDTKTYELDAHPQETTENSVDLGHFTEVHGYDDVKMVKPLTTEAHYLNTRYAITRNIWPFGELRTEFEVHVHGLGYSFVEVEVVGRGLHTRQLVLPTPLEPGRLKLTIGMSTRPLDAPGEFTPVLKLLPRVLVNQLMRKVGMAAYVNDVKQDFDIWQHKAYVERPILAQGDGPVGRYRRWCRQFYPEVSV